MFNEDLIAFLCYYFKITKEQFFDISRKFSLPRKIFIFYTRRSTDIPYSEIAKFLNKKSSNTIQCFQWCERELKYYPNGENSLLLKLVLIKFKQNDKRRIEIYGIKNILLDTKE